MGQILDNINKENDIKKIDKDLYPILAEEIRSFLIEKVSKTGGRSCVKFRCCRYDYSSACSFKFPTG